MRESWQRAWSRPSQMAVITLALGLPSVAAGQSPTAGPDSTAVVQTMNAFLTAFRNLEWEAFRAYFAEDATVFQPLRSSPMRNNTKADFEAVFGQFFEAVRSSEPGPPYLDIEPKDLRVQMLGEVAVITFHLYSDDSATIARRTFVLRKLGQEWVIVHLHGSRAEKVAPASVGGED